MKNDKFIRVQIKIQRFSRDNTKDNTAHSPLKSFPIANEVTKLETDIFVACCGMVKHPLMFTAHIDADGDHCVITDQ